MSALRRRRVDMIAVCWGNSYKELKHEIGDMKNRREGNDL